MKCAKVIPFAILHLFNRFRQRFLKTLWHEEGRQGCQEGHSSQDDIRKELEVDS